MAPQKLTRKVRATVSRMKSRSYVETSVVSYLEARPSCDAVTFARQIAPHRWWRFLAHSFDAIMSDWVLRDARRGEEAAAARRIAFCAELTLIAPPEPRTTWDRPRYRAAGER